jgi:excisionase family DNA binding protein
MYVTAGRACKYYGVTAPSLRRWADSGKIQFIRTPGGDYRYWIDDVDTPLHINTTCPRKEIIYARVSTNKQRDDLQRQVDYLSKKFPGATIEKEVGSGLGFNRKGIQRVTELVCLGQVSRVIVTHKDRISRFGFDIFEWICKKHDTTIVVESTDVKCKTANEELVEDMLAITHSFSSRMYGNRKFSSKVPEDKE